MSIALLINQAVSTTIAAIFLPSVGKHGYARNWQYVLQRVSGIDVVGVERIDDAVTLLFG